MRRLLRAFSTATPPSTAAVAAAPTAAAAPAAAGASFDARLAALVATASVRGGVLTSTKPHPLEDAIAVAPDAAAISRALQAPMISTASRTTNFSRDFLPLAWCTLIYTTPSEKLRTAACTSSAA